MRTGQGPAVFAQFVSGRVRPGACQRNGQDEGGAAAGTGHVDPPAHGVGPLVQASKSERAILAQVSRGQPASIIADFQRQHARSHGQVHPDVPGVGVLGDVGQRLLGRAVGHQGHARGQGQVVVAGAEGGDDAGAALEALGHPLQGCH